MTLNELDLLKKQADQMGLSYKSNIGVDALRAKIKAKLDGEQDPPDGDENGDGDDDAQANAGGDKPTKSAAKKLTREEEQQAIRDEQQKEQLKLVRIRISCLNPAKAQLKGEVITTGNRYTGTLRKFVPFGEASDNGYHVPLMILNELKTRKFNSVQTKKGQNGQIDVTQRLVPEFAIEELEPLTKEELAKLAASQAAAAGL